MLNRSHRLTAAVGFVILGLVMGSCSEAPEPVDVEPEAGVEDRVREATGTAERELSAETQARIDAFTADAVASVKRSADFLLHEPVIKRTSACLILGASSIPNLSISNLGVKQSRISISQLLQLPVDR